MGVAVETIHNWETGKRKPDITAWPQIITFLGYYPEKAPETLGERLLVARRHFGLSRRKMAKMLSVDPETYARWEWGARWPSQRCWERVSELVGSVVASQSDVRAANERRVAATRYQRPVERK
jgi:DNA-binding transcriptional regulator YiaG